MALDLAQFKENLQTIFDAANTTTAAHDLSNGMSDRVQKVLKINPLKIPTQASFYPYVTVFIEAKRINPADMAATQSQAKRRAELDVKVVGGVLNNRISDDAADDADDECEKLMENIEEVLRRNQSVSGAALWSFTTDVSYFTFAASEETIVRAGILNLQATILY